MRSRYARIPRLVSFLFFAFLPMSALLAVELDDANLSRISPHFASQRQLRWENVERAPQWVGGAKPISDRRHLLHYVHLEPGQDTRFRVPPRGHIRVTHLDGPVSPDQVNILVSNGSGLYRTLPLAVEPCGQSLIAIPDEREVSIARVAVPSRGCAMRLAIYTSRQLPLDFVPGYHCPIRQCGEPLRMADDKSSPRSARDFWCISPEQSGQCVVKGPARIRVESRFLYGPADRESLQTYRIHVTIDGLLTRVLELETTAEARRHVQIGPRRIRQERAVSRRQYGYVNIPEGEHQVTLDATARILCRIESFNQHAYADPQLNALPQLPPKQPGFWNAENAVSIWDLSLPSIEQHLLGEPESAAGMLRLAQRSARDNRFRDGGLRAAMLMHVAAAGRPDKSEVRTTAYDLKVFHTFYRSLLPCDRRTVVQPRVARFHVRSLRRPTDDTIDRVVGEQVADSIAIRTSLGRFVPIGFGEPQARHYEMPAANSPSLLRVAVDKGSLPYGPRGAAATQLWLELDGRRMRLDLVRERELPIGEFVPSAIETALSASRVKHGCYDSGNLGGPLSWQSTPAPLIETANCEIYVPQGTRTVRAWAESCYAGEKHIAPLQVALFYRASRPYQLTESAYYDMRRRTAIDDSEFFSWMVAGEGATAGFDPYALRELQNHWVPLVRMLRGHERGLASGVRQHAVNVALPFERHNQIAQPHTLFPSPAAKGFSPPRTSVTAPRKRLIDPHTQFQLGQTHFDDQRWAAAVEAWSALEATAPNQTRTAAMIGRVLALENMGDHFLASRELRGLAIHDPDPQLRLAALAKLKSSSREVKLNEKGTERWAGWTALRDPSPRNLADLGESLLANGRYDFALQVLLSIPIEQQPVEPTLLASYHAGWWRTFKATAQRLPYEQQAFWSAQQQLRWGNYAAAKTNLNRSGVVGAEWLAHLQSGEDILRRIAQGEYAERMSAIHDWEAWQHSHPGPRIWREEAQLVASCSGTASLRSVDRELYGQYYLAESGIPLKLSVQGPVQLRFEMRPLHTSPAIQNRHAGEHGNAHDALLDDRVSVRAGGKTVRTIGVIGNRESDGLQVFGGSDLRAGRDEPFTLNVEAGTQTIEIESREHPMAIRVFAQRAAYPLPVLPVLTRETVSAVSRGTYGKATQTPFVWKSPRSLLKRHLLAHVIPTNDCQSTINVPLIQPRIDTLAQPATVPSAKHEHPSSTVAVSDSSGGKVKLATHADSVPTGDDQAESRMKDLHDASSDFDQQQFIAAVVESNLLYETSPVNARIRSMRSRLLQRGKWVTRSEFDESAGVLLKPISGWSPESPEMRVRSAMLRGNPTADAMLNSERRLVFSVRNHGTSTFQIDLRRAAVGYLPSTSVQVHLQIDSAATPETIDLPNTDSSANRIVTLGPGEHRVELWLPAPRANHFVLVNIREVDSHNADITQSDETGQPISDSMRKYWVATEEQPLRFEVTGPAWLRIDELVDDQIVAKYELVENGTKSFALSPNTSRQDRVDVSHRLFRVFTFEYDRGSKTTKALHIPAPPQPVPDPPLDAAGGITGLLSDSWDDRLQPGSVPWGDQLSLWSLSAHHDNDGVVNYAMLDRFPLGHEDGTLRLQTGIVSRRALDEGNDRGLSSDEFVESSLTHYQHDYWVDRYCKTQFLSRVRKDGGPTTGVVHTGCWEAPGLWTGLPPFSTRSGRDPTWRVNPFNFRWQGYGYLQSPNTAEPGFRNDTEWSFGGSASASRRYDLTSCIYRLSTVNIFGRVLSLDGFQYAPGTVDQDVFTPFKAQHRHGLSWSQRLVWNTHLDRQLWLRFSARTNEDFNPFRPDSLGLELGQWGQSGWLQWGWSYRVREFQQDDDRRADFLQETLNFDAQWEHWTHSGRRFEITANYRHDLTQGRNAFGIYLSTYLSRGRGYWDQPSRKLRFGNIRKQLAIPRWLEMDQGAFLRESRETGEAGEYFDSHFGP